MIKKLLKLGIVLLIMVLMVLIPIRMYRSVIANPFKNIKDDFVEINASKGTFSGVLAENKESFRGHIFIKLYNKLNKVSITVKKGTYELPSDLTLNEIVDSLESGKYNTSVVKVTIPEGYTIEQIGATLEEKGVILKDEFITGCKEYNAPSYIKENKNKRYKIEGYLFPDTYNFEKGMTAKQIIDVMIKRFEEIITQIEKENGITISDDEIERMVVKASIIEREVSKEDEKPLVSSVIENRLKINMKLQIDATVLYAMGLHKDKVYLKDLKYKSPYNTYYVEGLPVGAISNPGKESLEASIMPANTNYLYYMTKDGTNHKFFKNYNEFLKYKNGK